MFDSTSVKAAELLSYFGKNTCVTIRHNYGSNELQVLSARTNNVIAEISKNDNGVYSIDGMTCIDLADVAQYVMSQKKFPKNRKMNKAWSPIRLTERAKADAEITRQTALNW